MRPEIMHKLCCPFDKADLNLTEISKNIDGKILEGFLWCTECKRIYPIVKGIPIMNPDEYRDHSLEKPLLERWQKHLSGKSFENFRLVESNNKLAEWLPFLFILKGIIL